MSEYEISKWDLLCEFAEDSRLKYGVPGIVLGILHEGDVKAAGFGVTNLDHPLGVNDQTFFQIGSISKTFSGTLIMKMVEEGKIDLDATVHTYVPEFKVADVQVSEKVTIRHLLTHTSGWFGDLFLDTGPGDDAASKYVSEMADLEQLAPIGQVWSYNNAGFVLLGYIIEQIRGQSYQGTLQEKILEPLGLNNTFFDPGDVITYRFATGHNGDQVARPWPLPRAVYPAGGITCSVHDLLAYAKFHMGDGSLAGGECLLQKESLLKMQTPTVNVWKQEHWGLTWAVDDTYNTRLVSHGGGTTGQVSQLIFAPQHDFAVAVFTNSGEGGRVTQEVTRQALKAYLGIEIVDPEPLEASAEQLAPFVGDYTRPFADVHLGLLGGRLVGQLLFKMGFPTKDSPPPPAPPPFTLGMIEEDRLMILDGPMKSSKVDIIREADGSIGWLRAGRIHKRVA
jgi:CubicO group peptidase (beta-lactamase class C family)